MKSQYLLVSDENYLTSYSSVQPSLVHGNSQGHYDVSSHEDAISCCMPNGSPGPNCSDEIQGANYTACTSQLNYCTLDSSLSARGMQSFYSSPSTHSYSSGSPVSQQDSAQHLHHSPDNTYGSTMGYSCLTNEETNLRHKLQELERMMLGPDLEYRDNSGTMHDHGMFGPETWRQMLEIQKGGMMQVLIACANAVADDNLMLAEWLINELKQMVSVSGEPMERVAAYMLEGLIARLASSGSTIYKSLRCKEPTSSDLLSYMHTLYEVCPYFKFAYMSANGAIAEALKGEVKVHIIDFQIAQGSQWITLIQALAARPGGPPHVRITGIDDAQSAHARGGGLQLVGKRLLAVAKSCNVPFEFNPVAISGCDVELEMLEVRPDEALAVNFPYQLHHMPDESVSTCNHRDRLLRLVKSLSPKVVTLVEQECNTNTAPFFPRFMETLNYYTAMFESIDVTLPRTDKKRISTEQHCVARDIVNIIACEGAERVERHELLDKWRARLSMAGFRPYPLSSLVNSTIKTLLQSYCEHYTLEERDGALYLGWKNRNLVTSSAWW
ncbi:Chitin-inducible gibberellin-responsive protein 2 [Nymphaea thermarum]|nr:Chitin-inducible gibberellin-responsive protein 2 [Nymphaea thermarum]